LNTDVIQPAEFWSRPPIRTSRLERIGGASLFLVVTVVWIFGLVSGEQGSIAYEDFVILIAAIVSALSLVITGYLLGRWVYALWFVWIPGAAMTAAGFWMNPTPGGDETGGALIFLGPLVSLFGGLYLVPLIALGVWLRRRRETPDQGLPSPGPGRALSAPIGEVQLAPQLPPGEPSTFAARPGSRGKTAAVVLVWLVLSFFWIGVLALLGNLIHPAIAPLWFVSAVVLALAVAWWMLRARGEPSVVAALACWWFIASIFGPVALVMTLPWLHGFRHRSLGWITTAVSGEATSRV
jgi:hypothetical protein